LRVHVDVETSQGVEVCVFNEDVTTAAQIDLLKTILNLALALEQHIRIYVEKMEEAP